jgi:hypothetical protein
MVGCVVLDHLKAGVVLFCNAHLMLKCFRNVYLNCLNLTACQLISYRIFDCGSHSLHVNRVAYVQQNVTAVTFVSLICYVEQP